MLMTPLHGRVSIAETIVSSIAGKKLE